jgi:hypothetical protein
LAAVEAVLEERAIPARFCELAEPAAAALLTLASCSWRLNLERPKVLSSVQAELRGLLVRT